jgi:hypothetical protein
MTKKTKGRKPAAKETGRPAPFQAWAAWMELRFRLADSARRKPSGANDSRLARVAAEAEALLGRLGGFPPPGPSIRRLLARELVGGRKLTLRELGRAARRIRPEDIAAELARLEALGAAERVPRLNARGRVVVEWRAAGPGFAPDPLDEASAMVAALEEAAGFRWLPDGYMVFMGQEFEVPEGRAEVLGRPGPPRPPELPEPAKSSGSGFRWRAGLPYPTVH